MDLGTDGETEGVALKRGSWGQSMGGYGRILEEPVRGGSGSQGQGRGDGEPRGHMATLEAGSLSLGGFLAV